MKTALNSVALAKAGNAGLSFLFAGKCWRCSCAGGRSWSFRCLFHSLLNHSWQMCLSTRHARTHAHARTHTHRHVHDISCNSVNFETAPLWCLAASRTLEEEDHKIWKWVLSERTSRPVRTACWLILWAKAVRLNTGARRWAYKGWIPVGTGCHIKRLYKLLIFDRRNYGTLMEPNRCHQYHHSRTQNVIYTQELHSFNAETFWQRSIRPGNAMSSDAC